MKNLPPTTCDLGGTIPSAENNNPLDVNQVMQVTTQPTRQHYMTAEGLYRMDLSVAGLAVERIRKLVCYLHVQNTHARWLPCTTCSTLLIQRLLLANSPS